MEILVGIIIFLLGLCGGSFVNMLTYRTAVRYELTRNKKQETNKNRSYCDYCRKQLSWRDNIPVISWLILRGKSRCCHQKLSRLYPIVELITGVLFLINGTNWLGMVVIVFLMFSAVFDYKYMILPDFSSYILIGLAIVNLLINNNRGALVAGIGSVLFIWILTKIKIKGKQAMGEGDIPLAGFMGLWLGWPEIIIAFYIAFIIGAVVGIIIISLKKRRSDEAIPFGPFLILGTIIAYFYGEKILYYFSRWL